MTDLRPSDWQQKFSHRHPKGVRGKKSFKKIISKLPREWTSKPPLERDLDPVRLGKTTRPSGQSNIIALCI